jgi:hypothetical protein
LVYCAYIIKAKGSLGVTNETQNIGKVFYLHGHYLKALYLVFIANPHILQIRFQTFWDIMLCYFVYRHSMVTAVYSIDCSLV